MLEHLSRIRGVDANRGITMETAVARLLPTIVASDTEFCKHSLEQLDPTIKSYRLDDVLYHLRHWHWIDNSDHRIAHDTSGLHNLYRVSESFWDDVNNVLDAVDDLPAPQRRVFRMASVGYNYMQSHPDTFSDDHVVYLGGVTLLAMHQDPSELGNWLQGQAGWEALIAVQELRPE